MKVTVQFKEGENAATHWRKQVTLPKKWLTSPCDRLKDFLIENYNKAFEDAVPLKKEEWHLANESPGCNTALGRDDIIKEVVSDYDDICIKPGASPEKSGWRREDSRPPEINPAQVIVPTTHKVLLALRAAVDSDNTEALKSAVEEANITSPHELLMAEVDVKEDDKVVGTEWHSVAGRFAWDLQEGGRGEDTNAKLTLSEYARRRGASRVLKLIDIADHCGAPILGGGRVRSMEEIQASAHFVADQVEEMQAQLKASQGKA